MANSITRAELRDHIRQSADMENTKFVSDAELNRMIDDATSELYDLIISCYNDVYEAEYDFTTTSGQQDYDLPTDFYKLNDLVRVESNGLEQTVFPYTRKDRGRVSTDFYPTTGLQTGVSYRLKGNSVRLYPTPSSSSVSLRMYYTPQVRLMTKDTDTFGYGIVPGWQKFIELSCAVDCIIKDMLDPQPLMARKMEVATRIKTMAQDRQISFAQGTEDVTGVVRGDWTGWS